MTTLTGTQRRTVLVLERMLRMTRDDEDDAQMISDVLEGALEELAQNDAFGTERQCDPRGDGRDGDWSMSRVQGVDN